MPTLHRQVMQFVYPQSVLSPKRVDELFQEEASAISRVGFSVSLIDGEKLEDGVATIKPPLGAGNETVYRGWMLTTAEYENLINSVTAQGAAPITSVTQYLATHHLPNWYRVISDLTPETVVLSLDADWASALKELGWRRYFVKDFVKSLKTSVGAVIERPEEIDLVASEMEKYRGMIEGGLCIRQVEDFIADTERRFFVVNRTPYAADPQSEIPGIVFACAERIESRFFSVDVITRADGALRVVEIGDGQVSDLVGWAVERFVEVWRAETDLD